jgi:hypothetical protein
MKRYSTLFAIIVAAVVTSSSLLAQDKTGLQTNATVLSILQANAGKPVELHLRSGEKIGAGLDRLPTMSSIFHLWLAPNFSMPS